MGEYASYAGEQIKIGTCENLYYLRADQAAMVTPNPVREAGDVYRFRFPWPDEDGATPGSYDVYDRGLTLWGMPAPTDDDHEHGTVQFRADNGYLCSLPCPEGPDVPADLTIHRNGYGGAISLVQQAWRGGQLVPILKCNGCGYRWNYPTLEHALPILKALAAMAAAQDERRASGNSEVAREYREIARRILAGFDH